MSGTGSFIGNLARMVGFPAGGALAAVLAGQGYVMSFGPHGFTRAEPVCPQTQTCVIVAGLDEDVAFGFGAGGQVFGMDVNDDMTQRLVSRLAGATAEAEIKPTILKYTRAVAVPEAGDAAEAEQLQATLAHARAIGRSANARLVVVGRVVGENDVIVRFVDPKTDFEPVAVDYSLTSRGAQRELGRNFEAALAAAERGEAPPPPTQPQPGRWRDREGAGASEGQPSGAGATTQPISAPVPGGTPLAGPAVTPASLIPDPEAQRRLVRDYPQDALNASASGEVDVQCFVNVDGSMRNCSVTRNTNANYSFARVAMEHARQRRGTPEVVDGTPTNAGVVTVPFQFRLAE